MRGFRQAASERRRGGGTVIWTRGGSAPDLRDRVRGWVRAAGFDELAFVGAPEAARALREHAVKLYGANRLVALVDPLNAASIRVAEKIGMSFERATIRSDGLRMFVYAAARSERRGEPQDGDSRAEVRDHG